MKTNALNPLKSSAAGFRLSPETIARAAELSQSVPAFEQQWPVYLRALGLFGFEEWLGNRIPDLPFRSDGCSLFHPGYASFIDAACCLEVGDFSLCAIATSNSDLPIAVPRGAIELPEFAAQFYVLMEVWEEEDWVRLWGGTTRSRLLGSLDTLAVEANRDWTYPLPASSFDWEPDDLLLQLRCLDADAIAMPMSLSTIEPARSLSTELHAKLATVKPQLQGGIRQPWQVFSWDEAVMLLENRDELDRLYDAQIAPKPVPTEVTVEPQSTLFSPSPATSTVISKPGDEFNRLLDWLQGIVSTQWSLPGTFLPSTGIRFCHLSRALRHGKTEPIDPQNLRREIAQLYASQPAKSDSESHLKRIVPSQMSDGNALAYLIQSVDDEGIRRQAVDLLQEFEPEHPILKASREKDLGIDLEGCSIALRVLLIPRLDDRYSVLVRVYPTGESRFLPEGLQLAILDEGGNELVAHTARERDDWIDRPLIVEEGERFGIRITLNESSVTETFAV
ncbi:DUF1822 family protein [Oscillatoriales cyanobacterium LEGE 11467]|uniref:DUF1822 family protein n=1 Tax=Zarconia navalis LEGE 11467 TaxID=1828826 RepID=A0A928Z8F6_9CYAN|nr:DUF1822 family protein [Zarconia navalis]MBE9040479.1 DUF1822 family protein [Zarconia navalis LEGE 11467]